MAVQFAPLFALETQFQAKNGRNLTGGFLRVFLAATDDHADTYSDYNGTRNPDNIVLDDDGRAVVICDKSKAYRLEVYDADGMLLWTEEPVFCSGSGGAGMSSTTDIISTDGTIVVEKSTSGSSTTFDIGLGVDMSRLDPSCLSADATARNSDGKFVFGELSKEGDLLSVDNYGCVRCEPAWYHFTAIVELSYDQVATNSSHQITLYTTLSNSVVDFDLSYAHRESIELSGDIHVVESNSEFVLGVTGLPNGVIASLVDFDIHAITGHEQSTEYTAGNGIDIADHVISADLDVVQHKLTAGNNITITGNVISAENLSQEQADWTQQDNTQPDYIKNKPDLSVYATTSAMETALAGKQDVISDLSTIRSGAAAGATALQPSALDDYSTTQEMNTALAAKQDVISDLSTIRSGAAAGATAVQPADMNTALATKQDVISDLATIRSGAALGATSVQPNDLATVATTGDYDDLVDKPDLSIYAESADLATVATTGNYADLSNRPSIPTNTSDLTNDSGFITSADVPVKDVQVDGVSVVNAQGTAEIDLSGYATTSAMNTALAGKQDTISDLSTIRSGAAAGATAVQPGDLATVATTGDYDDLVNKPAIPAAQVNSDWNAVSGVSQILNKPSLATVATTGDYDDLVNKPSIPAAQVNADWNSSSGVSEILNKPANLVQDANYVHTDENFTSAEKTKLAGIAAGAEVNVQADWTESDSSSDAYIAHKPSLATVATTGAYSDLSGTPSIPTATSDLTNDSGFITASDIPAQAQADWTESDSSDPSYIQNKPSLATVATTGAYSDLSGTPTIPTVDQSYNASSTNAQSGVAVAQAIAAAPGTTYTAGDAISIDQDDVISVEYDSSTLELGRSYTSDQSLSTIDNYYPYAMQTNSAVSGWIANGVPGETLRIKIPANVFRFSNSTTVHIAIGNSPASTGYYAKWRYYSGVNITLIGDGNRFYVAEQTIDIPLPLSASGWIGTVPTTDPLAITFVAIYNGSISEYAANAGSGSLLVAKGVSSALAVKNPLPASTSGDAAKVLTVDSNGDPAWTAPASATVDQVYNASSTNAQSGTAVAGALASYTPTASLATVATTGDYSDLSNTPTIPAAPVQSDWTEADSSSLAYIANKPNLATVATTGAYSDLSGTPTINNVPAVTSNDDSKVLKASYSGGVGSYSWETESGGTQVQSDWTEADNTEPSYIQNKPVPKTLTAGAGISISENQSTITIASSVTAPVRDVTVDGASVVSNGVAAITTPTVDQTYDASSANAQSGVAVAAAISAAVIPISVVSTLPASPDPNTLYVVTGV